LAAYELPPKDHDVSVRPILKYPDPRLRERCQPVAEVDERVRALVDDLCETLDATTGLGLAAPQVGATQRVIIYDAARGSKAGNWRVLVNPRIVSAEGARTSESEGCKSLPGLRVSVPRAERIRVAGLDRNGDSVEFEATGLDAAVIQHEIDHLDGILLIDRVTPPRRTVCDWQMKHLDDLYARLAWLTEEPPGPLLAKVSEHNGMLVVKEGSQIRLHFVDRWRLIDRDAFLKRLAQGKEVNLSGIMSRIDLNDPMNLLGVYTQAMMLTLAWQPNPRHVYMLGFGGGRIPMVLRHHFPEVTITASELDADVVDVARKYFGMAPDDRVRVTVGDGLRHLADMPAGTAFDILLVDSYSGGGQHPVALSTREFYALCKSRLTPGGVVATNLIESDPKFADKVDWFRSSFTHMYDFAHLGAHVLFGTDGAALTRQELVARAQSLQCEHAFHFPLAERAKATSVGLVESPNVVRSVPTRANPVPARTSVQAIGRNDPCPCGSGKKYKKCCLEKRG
jgi:peptide deformylase